MIFGPPSPRVAHSFLNRLPVWMGVPIHLHSLLTIWQ